MKPALSSQPKWVQEIVASLRSKVERLEATNARLMSEREESDDRTAQRMTVIRRLSEQGHELAILQWAHEQGVSVEIVLDNYRRDPSYRPYCLGCSTMERMTLVEPYRWRCKCGADYDLREEAKKPS